MRSAALLLTLAPLPALADAADARFLAAEALSSVEAKSGVPADANAKSWDAVPSTDVWLIPQHTVLLVDRQANAALAESKPRKLSVRACHDLQSLGVALEWGDDTETRASPVDPAVFGDTAALEIPEAFGAGLRLPYVGMGDAKAHVHLLMARAMDGRVEPRSSVAAGFGSSTRAGSPSFSASMRYDAQARRWRAVFVLPLVSDGRDLRRGLVPIAFAAWDGARNERGGNKALSRWRFLRIGRFPLEPDYLQELRFGYSPGDLGDPARGKMLAGAVCSLCHRFEDKAMAAVGLAPDLSVIGAIAAPSYLRSSLLDPSEVLVPTPNPNRHYQAQSVDPTGAHPNDPRFAWSDVDAEGRRVSKMPSFASMAPADIASIIAYLRTLAPAEVRQP